MKQLKTGCTKTKILVTFLLLLVIIAEGCVSQSSNIQSVGDNGTAVNGKYPTTITLQPGEKIYYIEGCGMEGFCDSNIRVGEGIADFAKSHNITKVEIQYGKNEFATGAYIIYK